MTVVEPDTAGGRPGGSPRRPTMGDVATTAGVSRALVSIVMRDAPGASEATRDRIRRIAREMGYVPDERARKLRQKSSRQIGVAFELQHAFHGDVVEQLYLSAEVHGYDLALSAVAPTRDELAAVESLIRERCEALIILSLQPTAEHLKALSRTVPVVSVARRLSDPMIGVVRGDDRAGMRIAVEYLVGLGHTRIAHIDGGKAPGAADRRASYRSSMKRWGLAEFIDVIPGGPTEEDGAHGMEELLQQREPPTAVSGFNDRCAAGALEYATREGLRVPLDVSIIGYDDSRLARRPQVQLTTISQDTHAQAEQAMLLALERLRGENPREVVVQPHLVVRSTTAAPQRGGHD